jgi:hypothetical protein
MLVLLSGVGVTLVIVGIASEFFRVMSWIVSIVSSGVIFSAVTKPGFHPQDHLNLLK